MAYEIAPKQPPRAFAYEFPFSFTTQTDGAHARRFLANLQKEIGCENLYLAEI